MQSRRSNSSGRTPIGRFLASRQAARRHTFEQLESRNLMVAQIDVRLAVVDTAGGAPLSQLEINNDYFLEAFVKDVRAVPLGVQSAYVDVSYDPTRVGNLGSLVHGSDFNDVTRGIVGASLLDDGGGQDTDFTPPAVPSQESLLFRLPFRAILSGTLTFTGAPSQNSLFPTTMFGAGSTPVPNADFVFHNASILVNSSPTITSNGGGASAAVSIQENTTGVTTVTATDPDVPADTISYSIVGGADQTHFTIDTSTGVLTFVTAPNFESPTDVGANNVYDVIVQAADVNGGADQQTIAVTVTGVNEPPAITSNGGGASASISIPENTTAVTTVTATDPDVPAQTLSYSLAGGADQSQFTINASTGALAFNSAPNFEIPTDSDDNNVYQVIVQVADGSGGTDQQTLAVTVTNANDAPIITSNGGGATASVSVAENTTAVTTVVAADADVPAQTITYSIVGGADQTAFSINTSTGALGFNSAPNFEVPTDAGANNSYEVIVQASDGAGGLDQQTISVNVTNANDPPIITSNGGGVTASVSIPENTTAVTTVTATDVDVPAQTLTYSLVGGADQGKFTINASSGALAFTSAPNFESPTDADANNQYVVIVQAADSAGGLDQQTLTVTVTNQNESPDITSATSVSVPENSTTVMTVTATDPDVPAQTLTYSITGGADQSRFAINASTGALTFVTEPDFETPTDVGADNVYQVIVQVSDGAGGTDQQAIAVTVTNANDAPIITSNGGGATAGINVVTGNTAVTTVTATDQDVPAQTLAYSLTGGADQSKFAINASTGVLTFVTPPNVNAPTDSNTDNVYQIIVQVADGTGGTDTQTLNVTVVAVPNDAPVITSNGGGATAGVSVAENTTTVTTNTATDADVPAQTLTWSLSGGADQTKFAINASTGVLSFIAAPNFESPTDANTDNVYVTVVRVTDTLNGFDEQTISVTVTNANDSPVITSSAAVSVNENSTAVGAVTATDQDAGATLTYSITGGADGNLFTINSTTGAVSFVAPPDFEEPNDGNGDGVYQLVVQVSDGAGGTATQTMSVTVTNVNDPPIITSGTGNTASVSVPENTTAIGTVIAADADVPAQTLTYSLVGGADQSLFTINSSTGALSFVAPHDFETPNDANTDNVYVTVVQVADTQGGADTQTVSVTVTNVNEAPTITSNGGGDSAAVSVAENTTAVTTVTATDPDVPSQTLTYSIVGGADQSKFTINTTTGALTFTAAPNFESPTDTGANNVYDVIVQVADAASATDRQTLAVTVTNVNDAPVITSNGGGASASVSVAESTTAVTTVTATDQDVPAQTLTFSLAGGADQAKFTINASTGALTFITAPNFDAPTDVGANNVYDVIVQVADGQGGTDQQTIAVTVTNVNQPPTITSNGGGDSAAISVAENTTAVTTVTATDTDVPAQTLTYSIVGGADQAKFTINASTGVLTFATASDFETPTDTGANNVYDVIVQVADTASGTDRQTLAVTVTNANDAPVITSNGGGASASVSVTENTTAVTTVTATDQDVPAQTLTFSLAGGADQAKFAINASTGALTFITAPNFEAPADVGANNVYDVIVQVADGQGGSDQQTIAVTVTNANDSPVVTVPAAQNINEDTALVFSTANSNGISVADPDSTGTFTITLTASNGAMTLASTSGITITSGTNGSAAITFTGSLANVNTALNGLSLLPTANFVGTGTVTVVANDGTASDTKSVSVTTAAINDAPTNTVPGAQTTPINVALVFSSANNRVISIADVDAGSSPMLVTLAVTAGTGTLSLSQTTGLTFATGDGAGDATMSFQGTITNVNAALNGLSFTPTTAFQGASTLTITTNDQGATGTGGALQDTDTVAITVDPSQGTISGVVYLDADNDGVRDSTEVGLGGVTVTLTGTVSGVAITSRTATTASDGSYSFSQLAGGTYAVQETQPTTMVDGKDTAGSAGGTVGADQITAITITGTTTSTGNNFGERGLKATSISRRLFLGSTTTTTQIVNASLSSSSNSNGGGGEGETSNFSAASLLSSSLPNTGASTPNSRIANPSGALSTFAVGEGIESSGDVADASTSDSSSSDTILADESLLADEPIAAKKIAVISDDSESDVTTGDVVDGGDAKSEGDASGEGEASGEAFEPLLVGAPTMRTATTVASLAGPITLTTEQVIEVDDQLLALQRQGIQLEFDEAHWSVGATVVDSPASQSVFVSPFDAHAEDDENALLGFVSDDVIAILAKNQ